MALTFEITDNHKNEFDRVYKQLDEQDLRPGADNNNKNIVRPIVAARPPVTDDGAGVQAAAPDSITLQDSTEINYRRRAFSYFHGAVIAVQKSALSKAQQTSVIATLAELYNQYEDPAVSPSKSYAKLQTPHSSDGLKKFVKLLQGPLKTHGLTAQDLKAGERLANLERPRPTSLRATTGEATVTETPLNAQMGHEAIHSQYAFVDTLNGDNTNYGPEQRHALYAYENTGNIGKAFLNTMAAIGWGLEKCGVKSDGMFSYFLNKLEAVRNKNKALQALTTAQAPKWYKKQNRVTREYLLEKSSDENLPALPATLRGIPGLPNMTLHEGEFNGATPVTNTVFRHGTLTPYEMSSWEEREAAAFANGEALLEKLIQTARVKHHNFWSGAGREHDSIQDIKIQIADISFMSPAHGEKSIGAIVSEKTSVFSQRPKNLKESNRAMKKENHAAYMHGVTQYNDPDQNKHENEKDFIASTINLGINGDRWKFSTTFESATYQAQVEQTLSSFEKVKTAVNSSGEHQSCFNGTENLNKFKLAEKAATALKSMNIMFNSSYTTKAFGKEAKTSKLINAELFASCLYAIVIQGMGGTVSACCKSSKDRTGLFLIHLDAMHQFYAETGRLIDFMADEHDPDRKRFVDIMSDLYLSNMQQTMASQTTYGAAGLKEPKGVGGALSKYHMDMSMSAVPIDLENAINKKCPSLLREQGKLAKCNKMKV